MHNDTYIPTVSNPSDDLRAALAETQRPDYGDEWTREHKGELIRLEGEVWACDDDYCGCAQPQVTAVFRNRVTGKTVVRLGLWSGTFRSEHEGGADEELAAYRASLDADLDGQIMWQGGIDYAARKEGSTDA